MTVYARKNGLLRRQANLPLLTSFGIQSFQSFNGRNVGAVDSITKSNVLVPPNLSNSSLALFMIGWECNKGTPPVPVFTFGGVNLATAGTIRANAGVGLIPTPGFSVYALRNPARGFNDFVASGFTDLRSLSVGLWFFDLVNQSVLYDAVNADNSQSAAFTTFTQNHTTLSANTIICATAIQQDGTGGTPSWGAGDGMTTRATGTTGPSNSTDHTYIMGDRVGATAQAYSIVATFGVADGRSGAVVSIKA